MSEIWKLIRLILMIFGTSLIAFGGIALVHPPESPLWWIFSRGTFFTLMIMVILVAMYFFETKITKTWPKEEQEE